MESGIPNLVSCDTRLCFAQHFFNLSKSHVANLSQEPSLVTRACSLRRRRRFHAQSCGSDSFQEYRKAITEMIHAVECARRSSMATNEGLAMYFIRIVPLSYSVNNCIS
jgi:hypothetical protein